MRLEEEPNDHSEAAGDQPGHDEGQSPVSFNEDTLDMTKVSECQQLHRQASKHQPARTEPRMFPTETLAFQKPKMIPLLALPNQLVITHTMAGQPKA